MLAKSRTAHGSAQLTRKSQRISRQKSLPSPLTPSPPSPPCSRRHPCRCPRCRPRCYPCCHDPDASTTTACDVAVSELRRRRRCRSHASSLHPSPPLPALPPPTAPLAPLKPPASSPPLPSLPPRPPPLPPPLCCVVEACVCVRSKAAEHRVSVIACPTTSEGLSSVYICYMARPLGSTCKGVICRGSLEPKKVGHRTQGRL